MTWDLLIWVMFVYLLAGTVKGIVGFGMPMISLALLAAVLGLKDAIILMLVPSLITNLWQGLFGGQLAVLLRRLWRMLVPLCIATWFASGILVRTDGTALTSVLGVVLVLYSVMSLATRQVPEPGRHELWMSPAVGVVTGLSTGLTGTFVVPGILYLQALRLGRDGLVQAMGLGFIVASSAMALSLTGRGALPPNLAAISALAVLPALLGMVLGQKVRAHLPEARFRRIFFITLIVLGAWLAIRSSLSMTLAGATVRPMA